MWKKRVALLGLLFVGSLFGFMKGFGSSQTKTGQPNFSTPLVSFNQSAFENTIIAAQSYAQRAASTSTNAMSIPDLKSTFTSLDNLRTYYAKDQIRNEIYDHLLKNPAILPLANQILIDNAFTREEFGEEQAVARIYAIALLKRRAQNGDLAPLESTALQLARILRNKQDIAAGEKRDLEDLLDAYFEQHETKMLAQDMVKHLDRVGYSTELKRIYQEAVFFALHGSLAPQEIEALLTKHFG